MPRSYVYPYRGWSSTTSSEPSIAFPPPLHTPTPRKLSFQITNFIRRLVPVALLAGALQGAALLDTSERFPSNVVWYALWTRLLQAAALAGVVLMMTVVRVMPISLSERIGAAVFVSLGLSAVGMHWMLLN
eukprot:Selendium_serpulae@DN1022_c0_g1_i2.p1